MEPNLIGQYVPSAQLLNDIMVGLRMRYASLNNIQYEAPGQTAGVTAAACMRIRRSAMPPSAACLVVPVGMSWRSKMASSEN
jgi:hypothetical protein